jgi:hypothetical protein
VKLAFRRAIKDTAGNSPDLKDASAPSTHPDYSAGEDQPEEPI